MTTSCKDTRERHAGKHSIRRPPGHRRLQPAADSSSRGCKRPCGKEYKNNPYYFFSNFYLYIFIMVKWSNNISLFGSWRCILLAESGPQSITKTTMSLSRILNDDSDQLRPPFSHQPQYPPARPYRDDSDNDDERAPKRRRTSDGQQHETRWQSPPPPSSDLDECPEVWQDELNKYMLETRIRARQVEHWFDEKCRVRPCCLISHLTQPNLGAKRRRRALHCPRLLGPHSVP